jgi:hypothetical protein
MLTFNYILNNVPHKKLGRKLYELWKGKKAFLQMSQNVRVSYKGSNTWS